MIRKHTLFGPMGVVLVLDRTKVIKDDPGADTPAIVNYKGKTATYWCACGEGEVDGIALPKKVLKWLELQDEHLTEFLYK